MFSDSHRTCFLLFPPLQNERVKLEMEGEKERQRQQREEKDSNEAEDETRSDEDADNEEEEDEDSEGAALVWQEGYGEDNLGLPIMHWEALSLRIAELEKQEEEKKDKRAKVRYLIRGWEMASFNVFFFLDCSDSYIFKSLSIQL